MFKHIIMVIIAALISDYTKKVDIYDSIEYTYQQQNSMFSMYMLWIVAIFVMNGSIVIIEIENRSI